MALYILHFDEPLGDPDRPRMSASHYLGFSPSARLRDARIEQHRAGVSGVAIMTALHQRGIGFQVGWLGEGDQTLERKMKRAGHHDRRCSICQASRLAESVDTELVSM